MAYQHHPEHMPGFGFPNSMDPRLPGRTKERWLVSNLILGFGTGMGPPGMLPSMHGPPGMPPMSRDGSMGMSFLSGAGQHPSMAGLAGAGASGQFHASAAALHAASAGQPPYHPSLPTSVGSSVPDLSSGVLSGQLPIGNSCWLPNPHDDANLWLFYLTPRLRWPQHSGSITKPLKVHSLSNVFYRRVLLSNWTVARGQVLEPIGLQIENQNSNLRHHHVAIIMSYN